MDFYSYTTYSGETISSTTKKDLYNDQKYLLESSRGMYVGIYTFFINIDWDFKNNTEAGKL